MLVPGRITHELCARGWARGQWEGGGLQDGAAALAAGRSVRWVLLEKVIRVFGSLALCLLSVRGAGILCGGVCREWEGCRTSSDFNRGGEASESAGSTLRARPGAPPAHTPPSHTLIKLWSNADHACGLENVLGPVVRRTSLALVRWNQLFVSICASCSTDGIG